MPHGNATQNAPHNHNQTQGIQQLLTAEKRAAEKVSEARKRKYWWNHKLKTYIIKYGETTESSSLSSI